MNFLPHDRPILFVDDDEIDRLILASVVERSTLRNEAVFMSSGQAALDYLDAAIAKNQDLPSLVVLDVNMPGLTGFDVLNHLGARPGFGETCAVVMLSSSDAEIDRKRAYELGADNYLCKPAGLAPFIALFDEHFTNDAF